jgi:TPR repeat protein
MLERSAAAGSADCTHLALTVHSDDSALGARDVLQGREMLERSAAAGSGAGARGLGLCLEYGLGGGGRDLEQAAYWYQVSGVYTSILQDDITLYYVTRIGTR